MRHRPVLRLPAGCGPRASAGAALALLLGLPGCSPPSPHSASDPDALRAASVLQYRRDAALGVLQVRVEPVRDAALERVVLLSRRFPAAAAVPRSSRLSAGRPVAVPVPHGPPDCTVPAGGPAQVELVVDGRAARLPVDPQVLDRVADRLCAAEALAAQVQVRVQQVVPDGDVLRAVLVLVRGASTAPLAVTGFGGNVLLEVAPEGPLPALDPADRQASVPLRITPARCDAHALAESKQTSTFRVLVRVGSAPAQQVLVRPSAAEQRAVERWVVAACR